jgi:hypothetical protein
MLADGAKLVVTFMNKDIAEPQKALSPLLRLDLDLPDGRHFEKLVHYPPGDWSAAKDHADVRLGENRFTGDLHSYRIQATAEEISVDATWTGEVPPWRPSTGYMLFGAYRSLEFAWLPSVPQGAVTVTYTCAAVEGLACWPGSADARRWSRHPGDPAADAPVDAQPRSELSPRAGGSCALSQPCLVRHGRRSDGGFADTTLGRVVVDDVVAGLPAREFRWHKGRRHYLGWF